VWCAVLVSAASRADHTEIAPPPVQKWRCGHTLCGFKAEAGRTAIRELQLWHFLDKKVSMGSANGINTGTLRWVKIEGVI
jgi:hypothetical protein